jgi:nucleoid DNA-binding protein
MKTGDLIRKTATITGIPKVFVRDAIETALLVIVDELAEDGEVKLRNIGKLTVRRRLPQLVVQPGTGIECSVKGPRVVKFSPTAKLGREINLREVG